MDPQVDEMIRRIRGLAIAKYDGVTTEHFHLRPCGGCSAPMWQQPCALCGFYPYGRPTDLEIAACKRTIPDPRKSFIDAVHHAGNLAVWYIRNWRNSMAWIDDVTIDVASRESEKQIKVPFRHKILELESRAGYLECASAELICDAIMR